MLNAAIKIGLGVGIYQLGKHLGSRDVNIKIGNKAIRRDTGIIAAFTCVVLGGVLVGAGIGDALK